MTIYQGSRYTNVPGELKQTPVGKETVVLTTRVLTNIDKTNSIRHTWIQSDRLDNLAFHYYGHPKYWWFILDANSHYLGEHEIQNGDVLLIPPYEELQRIIEVAHNE